jgi:hypothetical protein
MKNKIRPTVTSITEELRQSEEGWLWSRATTHRALRRIGFVFNSKKKGYYDRMRENPANVALRSKYLQEFFKYEEEGRQLVYMDETWFNKIQ